MLALVLIIVIVSFLFSFIVTFEVIKKLPYKKLFFTLSIVLISFFIASFVIFTVSIINLNPELFAVAILIYLILTILSLLIVIIMLFIKIKIEHRYIYDVIVTTIAPIMIVIYIIETDYIKLLHNGVTINIESTASIVGLTLPIILLTSLATLLISISFTYLLTKKNNSVYDEKRSNSTYFDSKNIFILLIGAIVGVFVLADIDYTDFSNTRLTERYLYMLDMYKFIFSAALVPLIFSIHKKNKTSDN